MATKVCKVCGVEKECGDGGEFSKNGKKPNGTQVWRPECKACLSKKKTDYRNRYKDTIKERKKAEYEANKESILRDRKAFYEENKSRIRERRKALYNKNKHLIRGTRKEYLQEHYRLNKPYYLAKSNLRYTRKLDRTPNWLSRDQIKQIESFYQHAKDCSLVTGEVYEVDHIVPLQGENISGLHVPWNLQVLPRDVNRAKSNKYDPDSPSST